MNALITKSTLSVFAVALTLLATDVAQAGLRGRVVLEKDVGPATLRVRLQSPDHVQWHSAPVRVRHHAPVLRVSAYDRDVAYRLSVITGIAERPLLRKRARGISWNRIARVHHVTVRELKIAKSPRRFHRWVERRGWGHHVVHRDGCGWEDRGWDDRHHGKGRGHGKGHGRR